MIVQLGRTLLSLPEWLGRLILLFLDMFTAMYVLVSGKYQWSLFGRLRRQILLQVWYTAVQIVPLLTLIAVGLGWTLMGFGFGALRQVGAEDLFVPFLQYGLMGEILPLGLTLVILARSSTAVTADVASQVVNGDLDVMKAHDMSIPLLITTPRILGILLSFLSVFGVFIGILVGSTFLWAPLFDIPNLQVQQLWLSSFALLDFKWIGFKLTTFSLLVGSIACYKGLNIRRDIRELPKASSQAVILTLSSIFFAEGIFLFVRWLT
jgi:phospholipid/cholesterol/gamma-HCH transport system permease protein